MLGLNESQNSFVSIVYLVLFLSWKIITCFLQQTSCHVICKVPDNLNFSLEFSNLAFFIMC